MRTLPVMSEKRNKVLTGLRLDPELFELVKTASAELTERARPGSVTVTDIMTQAIVEWLEGYAKRCGGK